MPVFTVAVNYWAIAFIVFSSIAMTHLVQYIVTRVNSYGNHHELTAEVMHRDITGVFAVLTIIALIAAS